MIRFILVCIVVIAYLVLTIPVLLVEWIIGKFSPMTKDISSLRMVQAIFKFILWITGAKVTVIGEENVKGSGCSLCSKPPELFRHPAHLQPLSDPHRLCCQEGNGALSAALQLDAQSLLSLSRQRGYQAGSENDPSGRRLCEIRHFRMYFPEGTEIRMLMKQKCCLSMTAASRSQPEPKPDHSYCDQQPLPISGRPISRR